MQADISTNFTSRENKGADLPVNNGGCCYDVCVERLTMEDRGV